MRFLAASLATLLILFGCDSEMADVSATSLSGRYQGAIGLTEIDLHISQQPDIDTGRLRLTGWFSTNTPPATSDGFPETTHRSFGGERIGDSVVLSIQIGAPTNPRGLFTGASHDNALRLQGAFEGMPEFPDGQGVTLRFVQ